MHHQEDQQFPEIIFISIDTDKNKLT